MTQDRPVNLNAIWQSQKIIDLKSSLEKGMSRWAAFGVLPIFMLTELEDVSGEQIKELRGKAPENSRP